MKKDYHFRTKRTIDTEARNAEPGWLRTLDHYAVFFAITGLLIFSTLSALSDSFYRRFGISSADVGIGYSDTLSHSWGFTCLIALAAVPVYLPLYFFYVRNQRNKALLEEMERKLEEEEKKIESLRQGLGLGPADEPRKGGKIRRYRIPFLVNVVAVAIYILACGTLLFWNQVDMLATRAIAGKTASPIRLGPFLVLNIFADRVTKIAPVANINASSIPCGTLMYLGISDHAYVLYRKEDKQIIRISVERFVLTTSA